ncbi:hypothetical protein [Jiella sp. M17.18]|uniref:hypothetical protein n=1 Tax=Jiella sp. M17.18 TaxID=3234247 RepID=UPI0034E055BA
MTTMAGTVNSALSILSLVCVPLLPVSPSPALAGAWTLSAGRGQAIVTGLYSGATAAFDERGGSVDHPDFAKGTVSGRVEYGLTDRVTILGSGEIGSERDGDLPFARPAMSEAAIGARVRMYDRDGFVASAQLSGLVEPSGDGRHLDWSQPTLEPRLLAGYGFQIGGMPAFVDAEAGYRYRTGTAPDEIRIDLTVGLRPWPDVLILAQSFSTISAGGGTAGRYDYHKAEGSVVYDVSKRWSLQAGVFATVAGTNALKERGLVTALWYRF